MTDIIMRFKSGREFRFQCEEYTIKRFKLDGTLSEFSYKGGVGECPVYFQEQDIECIAIIKKEQIEALEQVPSEDCIDRYSALAVLDPLSWEYKEINELPSVVPSRAESKRGEWVERESYAEDKEDGFETTIVCSCCDFPATIFNFEDGESRTQVRTDFCPNCGADMRGEQDG